MIYLLLPLPAGQEGGTSSIIRSLVFQANLSFVALLLCYIFISSVYLHLRLQFYSYELSFLHFLMSYLHSSTTASISRQAMNTPLEAILYLISITIAKQGRQKLTQR